MFKKKTYKNKVQTLFSFIKTSENLGIHKSDLCQVLDHFVSFCMPAHRSIISKDPSALEANVERLLSHITLDSEKKIFLSHLGDLERQPGQELSDIKYD